jgi:sulfatase modifying factor 1
MKREKPLMSLILAATAVFAACNGILGNDRVSLWNPDGGTQGATGGDSSGSGSKDGSGGGDATGPDATGAGVDAGLDASQDSGLDGPNTYALTIAPAGTGSGTVTSNPTGISCGATCSASFESGTAVTLTAAPAAGSTFTGWSGAGCSGTDTCAITVSAAESVTATFGPALPPSCAPGGAGMTSCGSGSESCCTSLEVDGGTYYRTYTNSGEGATGEADPTTVSGFRLDKYLVTVGRFRQFVNAVLPPDGGTGYAPDAGAGKHTHLNGGLGLVNSGTGGGYEPGWVASDDSNVSPTSGNLACDATYATWTNMQGTQETQPINCVNWWESYAFCIWDGAFLPSEAEWEYAAAGGSLQREYPWGSTTPGTGNQYAIYGCYYNGTGPGSCTGLTNIAPVGAPTLGAGLWGQLDLAGDLWNWNLDWYDGTYYPGTDSADLTVSSSRVFRGSNFNDAASGLLPPNRGNYSPTHRDRYLGLRCARAP